MTINDYITRDEAYIVLDRVVFDLAIRWKRQNLEVFEGEMAPQGATSSDPALREVWEQIWGDEPSKTVREALAVASQFVAKEGIGKWGTAGRRALHATLVNAT